MCTYTGRKAVNVGKKAILTTLRNLKSKIPQMPFKIVARSLFKTDPQKFENPRNLGKMPRNMLRYSSVIQATRKSTRLKKGRKQEINYG